MDSAMAQAVRGGGKDEDGGGPPNEGGGSGRSCRIPR